MVTKYHINREKMCQHSWLIFYFLWKWVARHKNKMEFIKWKLTISDFKEIFPPLYARRRYVTCVRNNLCYAYLWKIIMRTAYFLAEPCQRSHFFASHFIRGNTCAAIVTATTPTLCRVIPFIEFQKVQKYFWLIQKYVG